MLAAIPILVGGGMGGGSTLLSGLQAYYKLEDTADSSGNALTLTNNSVVTFSAGKVNNAANFSGVTNNWLSHVDATPYQMGTGNFTLALWVNFTTSENFKVFCIYGAEAGPGYGFYQNSATLLSFVADASNKVTTTGSNINDGAWHLVICTCDRAGNLTNYFNNVQTGTPASTAIVTGTVNNASPGLLIGGAASGSSTSSIDEVGLWNRVLTSTEMTNLWNGGTGTTYPFTGL